MSHRGLKTACRSGLTARLQSAAGHYGSLQQKTTPGRMYLCWGKVPVACMMLYDSWRETVLNCLVGSVNWEPTHVILMYKQLFISCVLIFCVLYVKGVGSEHSTPGDKMCFFVNQMWTMLITGVKWGLTSWKCIRSVCCCSVDAHCPNCLNSHDQKHLLSAYQTHS